MFSLKKALQKTKATLNLRQAFARTTIDDSCYEELETQLLMADVGIDTTDLILNNIKYAARKQAIQDQNTLMSVLKTQLTELLTVGEPLTIEHQPFSILMIGINGAGKTTTIGKLAHYFKHMKKSVIVAAGDTFRAAAIEQLQAWGERNDIPVVAQQHGSDSASVIYDAMQAQHSRNIDILLADTAGRLHTQDHLMEELKKVKRVMQKQSDQSPDETWLIIDGSTGQNALRQAKEFHEAMGITGIIMTKLDGTAKGGIAFALTNELQLPIRFIGSGESIEDIAPFDASDFVDELFKD